MNEAKTRVELIDPALKAAGWGLIENRGKQQEFLDFVLEQYIKAVLFKNFQNMGGENLLSFLISPQILRSCKNLRF
jgi:predicted type IV restriction endonuclease